MPFGTSQATRRASWGGPSYNPKRLSQKRHKHSIVWRARHGSVSAKKRTGISGKTGRELHRRYRYYENAEAKASARVARLKRRDPSSGLGLEALLTEGRKIRQGSQARLDQKLHHARRQLREARTRKTVLGSEIQRRQNKRSTDDDPSILEVLEIASLGVPGLGLVGAGLRAGRAVAAIHGALAAAERGAVRGGAGRALGRAGAARETAKETGRVLGSSTRRATPSLPRRAAGRIRPGRRPGVRRSGLPTRIPRTRGGWKRVPGRVKGKAQRTPTATKDVLLGRPKPGGRLENLGAFTIKAGPIGAPFAGAANFATATADDPGKTIGTTARAIPGIATAPVAIAADVGHAAITGDTGPIEGQWEQQKNYWKLVGGVLSGQGADIVDPKTGQTIHRTPEQIVQEDTGLVPAIGAGLAIGAVGRGAVRRVDSPRRTPAQIRGDRRRSRLEQIAESHPSHTRRQAAREKRLAMKAPRSQRRRERREESKEAGITQERAQQASALDVRVFSGRGRNRLDRKVEALSRERLTEKVAPADTLQLLGRTGLHGQPPNVVRRRVATMRAQLGDPSVPIHADDVATRDVLDALERNPEIAARPDVVQVLREYEAADVRRSVDRHSLVTGRAETLPNPADEPRRYRPIAREVGVPTEEYRMPPELRDVVDVAPRRGETMAQALRRTRSTRAKQVKPLERQAVAVERAGRRAAAERVKGDRTRPAHQRAETLVRESRTRAEAMRERAAGYRGVASAIDNVIGREGRAKALDRQARAAREDGDIEAAANFEAGAASLRRAVVESEQALSKEFVREMRERVRRGDYSEPIYFTDRDVTNKGALNVAGDYPGSKMPKREYRNMQTLAREGRIDEAGATLLESMNRSRVSLEMSNHARGFLGRALARDRGGNVLIRSGHEWRQRAQNFEVPPGMALFPVQEFKRAMSQGDYEKAARLIRDDPIALAVREADIEPGKKYGLVPEARLKEFRDQMGDYSGALKAVRASARIQSIAMLAFSPMWFGFQLVASPLAGVIAQPNPWRWAKAAKRYVTEFQKLDPYERMSFQVQYGGTTADAIALQRRQIGLTPQTMRDMADAASVGIRSPIGRLASSVWDHMRKGGPLISANRRYEGAVRDLVALIELDKRSKVVPERSIQFVGKVGRAHNETAKALTYLKDRPFSETVRYMTGERSAPLREAVDDALGDWRALTRSERLPAAVTVFYPFLRFSLRWLFHSMPRNHPVRHAILIQLAQANAEQLEMLLGGEPSFFQDWGKVVLHVSEDKPVALNLGRVAPGSNALMEVFGQGGLNLQTATSALQPVIGTTLSALAGQGETGRPSEMDKRDLLLRGLLGLVTPLRSEARKIGGESEYTKLFRAIQEREPNLKGYAFTRVVDDLSRDALAVHASALMRKAFEDNDYDARRELDALMAGYGLTGPITAAAEGRGSSSSGSIWESGSSPSSRRKSIWD